MLPFVVSMVILIIVLLFLVRFFTRYTLVRVNGESMMPTLKHGRFMILDRKFDFLAGYDRTHLYNEIFVVLPPAIGRPNIKRLISISYTIEGSYLWFEGDNKDHSTDSRDYGFLRPDNVLGKVVPFKEAFLITIGRKRI